MLQNCDAGEHQNLVEADSSAASAQSASENSESAENDVPSSHPARPLAPVLVLPEVAKLTNVAFGLGESLNRLLSAVEVNGDDSDSSPEKDSSTHLTKQLLELKDVTDLLVSCIAQAASVADGVQVDSNSLPPDKVAADSVVEKATSDVSSVRCGNDDDEPDASSSGSTNCSKTAGLLEQLKSALKPAAAVVKSFCPTVAAKVPEFTAQGNSATFYAVLL